jgi:hypothetical protein
MSHDFKFFRAGDLEQVRLDSGADLAALPDLDLKYWVALSCPVRGLEIDSATLALLDGDNDGRIRASEVIGAVQWCAARLKDVSVLLKRQADLPLSEIDERHETGRLLKETAIALLKEQGKGDATHISIADTAHIRALPGERTPAAKEALDKMREKIEDHFTRAKMAAFDTRAVPMLNRKEEDFSALSGRMLSATDAVVAAFPLAHVEAHSPLPLGGDVNPAWAERVSAFHSLVVEPILGPRAHLSEAEWIEIQKAFTTDESLTAIRQRERDLERLVRFHRDLFLLLENFVSFRHFYSAQSKAIFQAGTLYIDQRSCDLCVFVDDVAKHGQLANHSGICLAYCELSRRGSNEKATIAAAFTNGNSDNLMIGRNGVFYDRKGVDWDATITKIVDHPISIAQAFASPYKKGMKLIDTQIERFASAREKSVHEAMGATAASATPPKDFDVGKFAGIFAAIGLAIGAIGGAVGAIFAAFARLAWWQMPLAILGIVAVISGPSMIIAWLKLRQRNIAPLLDASGWAINAKAVINIPFGASLTGVARVPLRAIVDTKDPFAASQRGRYILFLLLVLAALSGLAYSYWSVLPLWLQHFRI